MKYKKENSSTLEGYKDSSAEALRYWVNSTSALVGANFTCNVLLLAMRALIEEVGTPDRVEQMETVITKELAESFDIVRNKAYTSSSADQDISDAVEEVLDEMAPETSFPATKKVLH